MLIIHEHELLSIPWLHIRAHSDATQSYCIGACPSALVWKSRWNTCYRNTAYSYLQSQKKSCVIKQAGAPSIANIIYSETNPPWSQSPLIHSEISRSGKLQGICTVRWSTYGHSNKKQATCHAWWKSVLKFAQRLQRGNEPCNANISLGQHGRTAG